MKSFVRFQVCPMRCLGCGHEWWILGRSYNPKPPFYRTIYETPMCRCQQAKVPLGTYRVEQGIMVTWRERRER